MISNPELPYPGIAPHRFTLNDLRVRKTIAEEPPSGSTLPAIGLALAVVLSIGAFIWLDPLHWFTPTEASLPAPAVVPAAAPARPIERPEIAAPLTPVPATQPLQAPIAPAHVVREAQVPASVVRPNAASVKPESQRIPMDKSNATVPQASPKEKSAPAALLTEPEKTAPPALATKPEEKVEAPIVPNLGDDTKSTPKPAAATDQSLAPE